MSWFDDIPDGPRKTDFTDAEKAYLRPVAETLAMLDGNAFFTVRGFQDREWHEQYLPEAHALFEANGGLGGWAGEASFAKRFRVQSAESVQTGRGNAQATE